MVSSPDKKGQNSQVLYMPAVSVVVSGDHVFEGSSLSYTYAAIPYQKQPFLVRLVTSFSAAITFVIAVFLFAIPVTVTSLILIGILNSPVAHINQNQDVPGIEKVVPYSPPNNSNTVQPLR